MKVLSILIFSLSGCISNDNICGGFAGFECKEGFKCIIEDNFPDATGTCLRDTLCSQEYDPVCSSGNKTYGNACEARKAGIKNYTEGECKK